MAGSFGWNNGSMINIGYNQKSGAGIGVGQAGTTNMYYPKYDYNKPEKSVTQAENNAKNLYNNMKNSSILIPEIIGGIGDSFTYSQYGNYSFRLTNGSYNGNILSPKIYRSGWNGGSVARITTYKVSGLAKGISNTAGAISTAMAYYEIGNGNATPITYVDAGVGTMGLGASAASYIWGLEIPVVGEVVAAYGWIRLWFDLGSKYGPSKWYRKDDTKWFK